MKRPLISVIVGLHNIGLLAAERSLHALTVPYQQDVAPADYEVHVVETGPTPTLDAAFVGGFGSNFFYHRVARPQTAASTSAYALDYGAGRSRGRFLALMTGGAPILTPRVLSYAKKLAGAAPCPVVSVRNFRIGDGRSPGAVDRGSPSASEDLRWDEIDWPHEPYRLFEISAPQEQDALRGWFTRPEETSCLILPRRLWKKLGGCAAQLPHGLLARCATYRGAEMFALLGEGSFDQAPDASPDVGLQGEGYGDGSCLPIGNFRQPPEASGLPMEFFGSLHPHSFLV